jgi:hypothetical protein
LLDQRFDRNVLPSAKFWEVWDKVLFGFTEWTHRPLGFMVLALAYRTGVLWNESADSNMQFDKLLARRKARSTSMRAAKFWANLRRSCRRMAPLHYRCGGVYTAYDKRVKVKAQVMRRGLQDYRTINAGRLWRFAICKSDSPLFSYRHSSFARLAGQTWSRSGF